MAFFFSEKGDTLDQRHIPKEKCIREREGVRRKFVIECMLLRILLAALITVHLNND